jgi:lipoprotein-releasing system ATP-binding protein
MEKKSIVIENVDKIYGFGRNELRVLKALSLAIGYNEIVSIVGPSGAGKSTLLNIIGCLDGFQSGRLSLLGRETASFSVRDRSVFRNRHIGFIFQLHNLLVEFNAVENIMMPLLIRRVGKREAKQQAAELLDRFGMSERASHKPAQLSGGECQRIAVARAIVGKPDIILADEPTGNLDSENSRILIQSLLDLGRENKTTIIIVTHDKDIANLTERTITLVDGRIVSESKNS